MSRCFPYPSLGYKVPGVRGEASIESIKIQKDVLTAKTEQKKEKKREKKDRKKEKKDKEVKTVGSILKLKKLENKIEPLEKSDLTEEHGPPCYLSDGSQSSSKRKREETPVNPAPRVLKIRINPPKKPEQPIVSTFKQPEPSTVSLVRHTDNAKDLNAREPSCSLRQEAPVPKCSNRREAAAAPDSVASTSTSTSKYDKKLKKEALKHKQLFEDWVPPSLSQFVIDTDEDQDWLFGTKRSERPADKRVRTDILHTAPEKADLWPHSRYLADAGIHALPYTVPF